MSHVDPVNAPGPGQLTTEPAANPAANPAADPGTAAPGPRALYRVVALAEMVTWALLITALALRGAGVTEAMVRPAGSVHGFVFLCYCVTVLGVWINQRWPPGRGLVALATAVIPFATVPFERWLRRRGEPDLTWRLVDGRHAPRTLVERLEARVLRHPLLAALLALALVTLIFLALLRAGPPTQWFG